VHSAEGWRAVLEPVIARHRETAKRLYFRGDAASANPEVYEFLEAKGMAYVIRLPANRVLQDKIGYLLKRQLAVSTAFCERGVRFTVAKDARRGDPGPITLGIRGMSVSSQPASRQRVPISNRSYTPTLAIHRNPKTYRYLANVR
jgi:Transposase DDE domain group 1